MTAPQAPAQTETKKSNKPLIFILVGCGGCLLLAGLGVVVLGFLGAMTARKAGDEFASGMIGLQLFAQQAALSVHLSNDSTRMDRIEQVYGELSDMADAGELKQADVEKLQKEIEKAEKDNKITGDEADKILDMAEGITGG